MTEPTPLASRLLLRLATVPLRFLLWLALVGIIWDAGALLFTGHSTTYAGAGYFWLRQMPGGMRTYGIALGVLIVTTIYAYGGRRASPGNRLLRWCLSLLAGWYVGWTFALVWGWWEVGIWTGAGGLGRTIAFAGVCALTARYAPSGG